MTTFPKAQAQRPAAAIAKSTRETTRAHARLDAVESVQSKQTTDIATGVSTLAAVETRLGGSTQETYLGTLGQMSSISAASFSGIGTLSHIGAAPTQSDFNNLIDDYNALNSAYHGAVTQFNLLLTELVNQNYMA